ncbi:MAG: hypothetical protein K6G63_07785 [Eubacterium sp.]|nr:hypothetical protein [Eubacterium sp.]
MSRKLKTILITVGSLAVVILLLGFLFEVKTIQVEGNTFFSDEVVAKEVCNSVIEKNVLTARMRFLLGLSPKLPYVDSYEMTFPDRGTIKITLNEKKIVAGIKYMSQYIYFDRAGIVLRSSDVEEEGIPVFETEAETTFSLYEKVQMKNAGQLGQIMNLAELFEAYDVHWDRVEFDSMDNATLYCGETDIKLGKKDDYDTQISALSEILKKIEKNKLSGSIDMTNYKYNDDVSLRRKNKIQSK